MKRTEREATVIQYAKYLEVVSSRSNGKGGEERVEDMGMGIRGQVPRNSNKQLVLNGNEV